MNKYAIFKTVKDHIIKGCFTNNLGIMTKYELILQCKALDIDRYSALSRKQIIEKITEKKRLKIQEDTQKTSFFYPEIHQMIFSFANFYPDEEELIQNRVSEIERAIRLHQKQMYCTYTSTIIEIIDWFKNMEFEEILLEKMIFLSRAQLWELYVMESEKIVLLSQNIDDIFVSNTFILQWFSYLFYKDSNISKLKYHLKCTTNDVIRDTFCREIQHLLEIYPNIWKISPRITRSFIDFSHHHKKTRKIKNGHKNYITF